jgi:hypothetical protein
MGTSTTRRHAFAFVVLTFVVGACSEAASLGQLAVTLAGG